MRLPFLQMESDLIAHGAAEVAHLAGCPVALALGHIAMVRAWAVSAADDSTPPDGWVAGEAAGRRIEAAAQWTGERGRLLQALLDAGQVRSEDGGIRVLHLEPYAKAWEVNRTSKERMRKLRERSANTGERTAKFDGQTQTQTQTQTQKEETASALQETSPVSDSGFALTPPPASKRRQLSKAEALFARIQFSRQARCDDVGEAFVAENWPAQRQNRDLKPILAAEDGLQARFEAAWALFLGDDGNKALKPAWSFAYFMSSGVRAKYETMAAREEAA